MSDNSAESSKVVSTGTIAENAVSRSPKGAIANMDDPPPHLFSDSPLSSLNGLSADDGRVS